MLPLNLSDTAASSQDGSPQNLLHPSRVGSAIFRMQVAEGCGLLSEAFPCVFNISKKRVSKNLNLHSHKECYFLDYKFLYFSFYICIYMYVLSLPQCYIPLLFVLLLFLFFTCCGFQSPFLFQFIFVTYRIACSLLFPQTALKKIHSIPP